AHKSLTFRMLVPGGKQPQLKGRLVVERDGVLQISSPSSQPWLDTNLALVRLAQSMDPDSLPIIYDFHWDTSGALPDAWHPDAKPMPWRLPKRTQSVQTSPSIFPARCKGRSSRAIRGLGRFGKASCLTWTSPLTRQRRECCRWRISVSSSMTDRPATRPLI